MWKLKVSPKVLKATEKYIASLGRKREELTEEQWNLMVKYVENRRIAIPILLFCVLFCIGATYAYWYQGHKYYIKAIPHHSVTISFDNQKEPISLSPEEIRHYLNYVADRYMIAGMQLALTIFMLIFFIGSITLTRIANRKAHRILLSRPSTTEVEI